MEANQNPTSPIAGEPAQSIGVAIGILDEVIHTIKNPEEYIIDDPTQLEALEEIMTHLEDAYNASVVADVEDDAQAIAYNTEPVGSPWEKAQAAQDEEMPADYWNGEMRAEAEAERRADAALELAAELASCDWEGWN